MDEKHGHLEPWQSAWLQRYRNDLILRMDTMPVMDLLITLGWMSPLQDDYQNIRACHEEKRNERARLLLHFVDGQSSECFWGFQEALAKSGCKDLAAKRGDEPELVKEYSCRAQTTRMHEGSACRTDLPATVDRFSPAVVKLREKMTEDYSELEIPSLSGSACSEPVALDELHVNICLLSAAQLDTLCGSPGQKQPFGVASLKDKSPSVIELENVFERSAAGRPNRRLLTTGVAGAGKTFAFMLKAAFEWSKTTHDLNCSFWGHADLFFKGTLTNRNLWQAKTLKELFRLSHFGLSDVEQDEALQYICANSHKVVFVADAMDEAKVEVQSLLWQVLVGKCEEVPKLSMVICGRPCERMSWLAKHCLFHRRLEVVGFTEEKIEQFIRSYFRQSRPKAHNMLEQVKSRPEVQTLMHTPLLATLLCRLFRINKALPSTHTKVYESAVLAMLQQTVERQGEEVPRSVLANLTPPGLQSAMESLCRLAYTGLSQKQVVFTTSELKSAGCLGTAVELGFLSLSPGSAIPGQGEDAHSFAHHTVQEFFAAVHAVREIVSSPSETSPTVNSLMAKHGVDGDYARFWPFVGGLLLGEQCECLLEALAEKVTAAVPYSTERSQLMLLMLRCHSECSGAIETKGSESVRSVMKRTGLNLRFCHLSVSECFAITTVLNRYGSVVRYITLRDTSMDTHSQLAILTSLNECTHLWSLHLSGMTWDVSTCREQLAGAIAKNKDSLKGLFVHTEHLSAIAPVIKMCVQLTELGIGDRSVTDESSQAIVDILRHQQALTNLELAGSFSDIGFREIGQQLREMAQHLWHLALFWPRLSPSLLSATLSSLTKLKALLLLGVPIGDDGLRQVAVSMRHLTSLEQVFFMDADLTWRSLATMETLLNDMSNIQECYMYCEKSSFPPLTDLPDILQLTAMTLKRAGTHSPPLLGFGFRVEHFLDFFNHRSQILIINLFG